MWQHFTSVNLPVPAVGKLIGGKVQQNIELGMTNPKESFTNACAIRMSYSLLRSGVVIAGKGSWKAVSGADKKLYIYRIHDLLEFLQINFGKPDKVIPNPTPKQFKGLKGLIVFDVHWENASGHATLWDGNTCSDHCYFPIASKASIWLLK